ncbi:MAG: hypothetical protein K0B11_21075 [Mariniphaga sp.]|nr:hypothetical protein [Mariniphaga sp.]
MKALSFDGVDDYVGFNNIPIGQSMTLLVMAKSSTTIWNINGWVASARGSNGFIIHPDQGGKTWKGYIVDSNPSSSD